MSVSRSSEREREREREVVRGRSSGSPKSQIAYTDVCVSLVRGAEDPLKREEELSVSAEDLNWKAFHTLIPSETELSKQQKAELEKKTKAILNLIEGDADSFAQRAEIYYRKRPELVNLIEDFYRSYRYLAEQHELLRSEAGVRRTTPLKSDSLNQSISQKTWDSTEIDDYPESEVSEIDNPEPEEADQIDCLFIAANEEFEIIRRNLEAKSPAPPLISEIQTKINSPEVLAKIYKSKKISYSFHESVHQDEIKLMEAISPSDSLSSKKRDKESDDCKADELETKALFEKIVDSVAKLTSEVESLKTEKETLMAELERKDEEKRDVIRQLSLTVEILKEENGILKKLIKDFKQIGSVFELKKLKEAFSGTRRLFGLASRFQPSLVAL